MKNSTKFILIVLAAIVILFVVLTVTTINIVSEHLVIVEDEGDFRVNVTAAEGERIEREYNFTGFNELEIAGSWDILVIQDADYRITVDVYESDESVYEVSKSGGALRLGMENLRISGRVHGASATIYMPELTDIHVDGAVNMNIEGFTQDNFSLSLNGAGNFNGDDCDIENFIFQSNGAVNVNFGESEIENADVYLGGAGLVELNMTGGVLEGKLDGFANLEYSGEVSRLAVEKDGIGSISRVD